MAIVRPAVKSRTSNPNATYNQSRVTNSEDNSTNTDDIAIPEPLSSADLITGDPLRELILLASKDGCGKSSAIISVAAWVEMVSPASKFYIVDSENKIRSTVRSFGSDAPGNIVYYFVKDMNEATAALRRVVAEHSLGDWLAVESLARFWEKSQDLGYLTISGYSRAEYLDIRRAQEGKKAGPVTNQPDQFWQIVKGAHDGAFIDKIVACSDLNVIMSTTMDRPPKESGFMKESIDRKAIRAELGIDCGLAGAPRIAYLPETLALLEMKNGLVTCRVLRDNLNPADETRLEFEVPTKKDWAKIFFTECRQ